MSDKEHKGPIYGVELIDSLPLGDTGMTQAMPSSRDLAMIRRVSGHGDRVAAGYEVLLYHWRQNKAELERLQAIVAGLKSSSALDGSAAAEQQDHYDEEWEEYEEPLYNPVRAEVRGMIRKECEEPEG